MSAVLAIASTFLILDAAYGTPSSVHLEQVREEGLYLWRYKQAKAAARHLKYGLIALVLMLTGVIAVVIMTWFAPAPTATPNYQVIDPAGRCGQVEQTKNGQFRIVQDGTTVALVSKGQLATLRLVAACP